MLNCGNYAKKMPDIQLIDFQLIKSIKSADLFVFDTKMIVCDTHLQRPNYYHQKCYLVLTTSIAHSRSTGTSTV